METEEEALTFLEEIRVEHRMARHNVYAYIIRGEGASERVRYSDDGEPQKTAGLPTLEALKHAGLSDVIVVVTRYFGGTLLGTGGLVRAYTQATQAGIAQATLVTISTCIDIHIQMPYSLYDQTMRIVQDCGAKTIETNYTDSVELTCRMGSKEPKSPFSPRCRNSSAGKIPSWFQNLLKRIFKAGIMSHDTQTKQAIQPPHVPTRK